ncbi:hypothetical protein ACIBI4_26560 [Streptomyces sp. NPDC050418]|uniref:hypothetical protein n=1 Tax=Streptomyces sp. NPDC050418 TaxID=3365612 RepID=UPI00379F54C9
MGDAQRLPGRAASAVAVLVLFAAALVSCGSSGGEPSAEAAANQLTEWEPPGEEARELLRHAEQLYLAGCLRSRGVSYSVRTPDRVPGPPRPFPYGIDDMAWARSHGFGTALRQEAAAYAREDPNRRYRHALDGRSQAAYDRKTAHCARAAGNALYGDGERWQRTDAAARAVTAEVREAVRERPRYRKAQAAWSSCMRGEGFDVTSPLVLAAYFGHSPAPERGAAVAEARCVTATGLARTGRALEPAVRAKVYAEHAAVLEEHGAVLAEAVPYARQVVAQLDHR